MNEESLEKHPIIFFDGVCGMCNHVVDLLLRLDRSGTFLFAPIQGTTARDLLPPLSGDPSAWSLLYLDETGIREQSDAALEIGRRLGGLWWPLSLLRIFPRFLRNAVYRLIARYRYRVFGKHDICRIPSPSERERFLP